MVRPGKYEAIKGETLKDVINYAGGLKSHASNRLLINRIAPLKDRSSNEIDNKSFYIDYSDSDNFFAQDGDKIIARKMMLSSRQVELIGQVKSPGVYSFYEGMTLFDLIQLGSGFSDSTFFNSVYKNKAEIIRRNPQNRYEKIININLSQLNDEDLKNIKLSNLDKFVVHSNLNFFERSNVLILGEVNVPGSYPIINDNETLENLISRAGGFTSMALKNGISLFRQRKYFESEKNILQIDPNETMVRVAWESEDVILMPGDSILIKEKTRTINVSGEVYNPGLIEFRKGKSLSSYINDAGGITENGNKNKIIVIYANGVVVPKKWYNSPSVFDGSTIIVNKKQEQEPFDITQFATNWTQIISSLITAIVLSQQVSAN